MPEDEVPVSVRARINLPDLPTAIRETHLPSGDTDVRLLNEFRSPAQCRLIFDEFFWLECGLALKKSKAKAATGIEFVITDRV
jgi:ATP-dependent DNA helicase RecG